MDERLRTDAVTRTGPRSGTTGQLQHGVQGMGSLGSDEKERYCAIDPNLGHAGAMSPLERSGALLKSMGRWTLAIEMTRMQSSPFPSLGR
jgi:hypothetical protein